MNAGTFTAIATATACIAMLGVAAWCDTRTRRIPNLLVLGGSVAGIGMAVLPMGIGFENALLGLGIGLAALLPFYIARVMGAGDVKLMAAAGAFVGYPGVIVIVLWTLIAGGFLSLAGMLRGEPAQAPPDSEPVDPGVVNPAAVSTTANVWRVPYAIAIAIGTTAYFIFSSSLRLDNIF